MAIKGLTKKLYQRMYMRLQRNGGVRPVIPCFICGYELITETHHIDRNHDNCDESNLMVLCPNCHALLTRKLITLEELTNHGAEYARRNKCRYKGLTKRIINGSI